MAKIWLYRWIFDPIHEWHYNYINNSISDLNIDNLKLIVKILWEKDLIASLYQRIGMIKIQIWENKINTTKEKQISLNLQILRLKSKKELTVQIKPELKTLFNPIWWKNKNNFEQIRSFIKQIPLRFTKWLFAFYLNDFNWNKNMLNKLTKEQKILYWLS